ncbi:MAG: hypothetical protein LBR29_01615 [Methylobacteriaceae bacterium]|jgi:hypothetical protein|nr:hypothetical protein [Methylobacteriaceae bacterium]
MIEKTAKPLAAAGLRLDGTVTVGHLLTFFGFLMAGYGAYAGTVSEIRTVDTRLRHVEKQIDALPGVLISTSRQDERILHLTARLAALETRVNTSGGVEKVD